MKLQPVNSYTYTPGRTKNSFKAAGPVYEKGPVKSGGEKANAILATVVAGLGFGAKVMFEIFDSGDGAQFLGEKANKLAKRIQGQPNMEQMRKSGLPFPEYLTHTQKPKVSTLREVGGTIAVLVGFIGVIALAYTLFNMPKAMYNAKVNTVKKQKAMDVYIRGNEVEKELYNQMNDKAKDATEQDKEKLRLQYAKLKMSKNVVPDFVKMNPPNSTSK